LARNSSLPAASRSARRSCAGLVLVIIHLISD
jgi:hypothetical protein